MEISECSDCHGSIPQGEKYEIGGRLLCGQCANQYLGGPLGLAAYQVEVNHDSEFGVDAQRHHGGTRIMAAILFVAGGTCLIAAAPAFQGGDPLIGVTLLLGAFGWFAAGVALLVLRRILICLEAALGDGKTPKY
jgi:hypothetical protein